MLEDSEFLLYSWNCDTNLTRSQNDRISHQFLGKRALEFIRERRSDTLVLKLQRQWRPLSELQLLENTESLFGLINGLSAAILIIHNGLHQPLKLSLQLYGLLHHHPWIRLQHPRLGHVLMNDDDDDDPNGSDTPKSLQLLQQPQKFICIKNWKFWFREWRSREYQRRKHYVSSSLLSLFYLFFTHCFSFLKERKFVCLCFVCKSESLSLLSMCRFGWLLLFCWLLFSLTFNCWEENKDITIKTQAHKLHLGFFFPPSLSLDFMLLI